jgi:predicted Fe-Mo cluster-binding NifX family protein
VSPVFDVANDLLLVDVEGSIESHRESRVLSSSDFFERAREILDLGAELLICGAISLTLETAITATGVDVYSFLCGNIEEIVSAILDGDLENPRYLMPGRYSKGKRARL